MNSTPTGLYRSVERALGFVGGHSRYCTSSPPIGNAVKHFHHNEKPCFSVFSMVLRSNAVISVHVEGCHSPGNVEFLDSKCFTALPNRASEMLGLRPHPINDQPFPDLTVPQEVRDRLVSSPSQTPANGCSQCTGSRLPPSRRFCESTRLRAVRNMRPIVAREIARNLRHLFLTDKAQNEVDFTNRWLIVLRVRQPKATADVRTRETTILV